MSVSYATTLDEVLALRSENATLRTQLATSQDLCTKFEAAVGDDLGEILSLRSEVAALRASAVAEPVKPAQCAYPNCNPADQIEGRCCGWIESAHPTPAAPVPASVTVHRINGPFASPVASLPAPEAAPTREEPTAEAIREILRAHVFATRHYEIRGLDEAANAILAIKSAPAK